MASSLSSAEKLYDRYSVNIKFLRVMCWPETDTFNNNVILWGREGSWQPQNVRYTVCITPVPVSQCIIKYTTHHHNICIEASEGIIHEATCQVMISSKQNRHNISVPRNLIFYNFVTMMGEAETVGVAQTVWRWYSGWGAMEESPESGDTDWHQSSQTSYGGGFVVKRKWI